MCAEPQEANVEFALIIADCAQVLVTPASPVETVHMNLAFPSESEPPQALEA